MIFKENNKAIFLQIADRICDDILTSTLKPDERIASVRAYAASIEVNANTVMRAYEYLASRGIVYNKRGIGFFVAKDAPQTVAALRKAEFVESELQEVFKQLEMLGISPEALKNMYSNYLNNKDNK